MHGDEMRRSSCHLSSGCASCSLQWEAYLVEANPRFDKPLEQLSARFPGVLVTYPETAAFMCPSKTSFYLDTQNAKYNYWGSSLSTSHADVKASNFTNVTVDMVNIIENSSETKKTPPGGLWLGGKNYKITRVDADFECSNDVTLTLIFAKAPKRGVQIAVTTGGSILVGFMNEEKGQNAENLRKTVIAFGEYMAGIGY